MKQKESIVGRSFLTLLDYTPEEIHYLIELSEELKEKKKKNVKTHYFAGKNIAMIFEKTSTRTRCAFEVAAHDLGMGVTYLDLKGSQIGQKESIADTARVLGRMYEGIEYRGYGQEIVEELAKYSGVPVWNGLTNEYHPTQMLADLLTIKEQFGRIKGIRLTYMGDAKYNMGNSLMIACSKMGMHFTACAPKAHFPNSQLVERCKKYAEESGGSVRLEEDVEKAVSGCDVVYTDVWVSMGEPEEVWEERINMLLPYQVNQKVMDMVAENAVFMHCLPAFHNVETTIGKNIYEKYGLKEMEVTDEVFESFTDVIFREAENRMHTIKAVMAATLQYNQ
ncbi:MAG: ornithine carbamoyltransferase [Lachnoclostridium sp.]|jgi:ornithine carbamoyltransferase|nr:ornithine carbamoyltransferase [Lachnoclostridium sp.]